MEEYTSIECVWSSVKHIKDLELSIKNKFSHITNSVPSLFLFCPSGFT